MGSNCVSDDGRKEEQNSQNEESRLRILRIGANSKPELVMKLMNSLLAKDQILRRLRLFAANMVEIRLIIESQPNSGAWNMALDEALLDSVVHRGECTVRVYRWSEPTVSLGYFQSADDIDPQTPWAALPRVRRLSGGGAILHDHEWTYSCAVPAGHPAIRTPHALYETVHRRIIDVLAECGVHAALRGDESPAAAEAFLCFARGDSRDIVYRGRKIVGSAQRRRKGAVLQHGSILMRASPLEHSLEGIADLFDGFPATDFLGDRFGRAIATVLGDAIDESGPTAEEIAWAGNRGVQ
jgi:lipoyl(octanoyl) transferase